MRTGSLGLRKKKLRMRQIGGGRGGTKEAKELGLKCFLALQSKAMDSGGGLDTSSIVTYGLGDNTTMRQCRGQRTVALIKGGKPLFEHGFSTCLNEA